MKSVPNCKAENTRNQAQIPNYNSWLPAFLPGLPVFLGRRSRRRKVRMDGALLGVRDVGGILTLVNVGENTTLGNGDVAKELVQLLVVADGELKVARDDTGLLVIAGSVTGQLEDLGSEVLENGGQVHGGTGTNTLSVVALAEQAVDTTDGEGETSLGRTAIERIPC